MAKRNPSARNRYMVLSRNWHHEGSYPSRKAAIKAAEEHCKSLPPLYREDRIRVARLEAEVEGKTAAITKEFSDD